MPYIDRELRTRIDEGAEPVNIGQLTYKLTHECVKYLGDYYTFEDLADVIAALEAAKLEFYSQVVRPYEDRKKEANGDLYPKGY